MNDDIHRIELSLANNELTFEVTQDWPSGQTVTTYINRKADDDDLVDFLNELYNITRDQMVTEKAPTPLPLR